MGSGGMIDDSDSEAYLNPIRWPALDRARVTALVGGETHFLVLTGPPAWIG